MRSLTVVRHCAAEPTSPGGTDFDRELTEEGVEQARQLRERFTEPFGLFNTAPTTALVSAARRTRDTFEHAFGGLRFIREVHTSNLIYNGRQDVSGDELLFDLAAIDPVSDSLIVVAHFPTVWELVLTLASDVPDEFREDFPLGAATMFEIREDEPVGLAQYRVVTTFVPY